MRDFPAPSGPPAHLDALSGAARRIRDLQDGAGLVAWFEDGPWDPWNHVECAMALNAMGEEAGATRAFDGLAACQLEDGSWFGEYGNALPMADRDHLSRASAPAFRDTNFVAYVATGIRHDALLHDDARRTARWWPMVRSAMDFVIRLESPGGGISWCAEASGTGADDALLAGNASIARSLDCAIALAGWLGKDAREWCDARKRLRAALRHSPERFDRSGKGARYAMDWYYPVLSGVLDIASAKARLAAGWPVFVSPGLGCRCVADEPWVTVAESAELVMALAHLGQTRRARRLLEAQLAYMDSDGAFWMGWQFEEQIFWPREKPSWTQAAMILAADALDGTTPAARLLIS